MIKRCLWMFIAYFLFCPGFFAAEKSSNPAENALKKIFLGEANHDKKVFVYHAKSYNLYELFGTSYISLSYLIDMGGSITQTDQGIHIDFTKAHEKVNINRLYLKDNKVFMSTDSVYLGNVRTYSVRISEETFIPVEALTVYFDMKNYQNMIAAERKWNNFDHYITINTHTVCNESKYMLRINLTHIYWDGRKFIDQHESDILIMPYQKAEQQSVKTAKDLIYITTVLTEINGFSTGAGKANYYGQKNVLLFKKYTDEIKRERLSKLFKPYRVFGTIKNDMGPFKKGDQVEIWRAEKRQYYEVKVSDDKKMMLPCSTVTIEGDKGLCSQLAAKEDIEDYVSIRGIESKTDFLIWTDIYRQRTYILKKETDGWKLQKIFKCSSGKNVHLTPTGLFALHYTIPYFGTQRNFRCKNAVVFYKDYMFHSILFDSTGKYVKAGKYQLGQRVSHGCVRLSEEDSAWLYHNVPLGTTVWIE